MFLGCQKIYYHAKHCNIHPKEKGFRKIFPLLERPVHVAAERELKPKLRMEEEGEGEGEEGEGGGEGLISYCSLVENKCNYVQLDNETRVWRHKCSVRAIWK